MSDPSSYNLPQHWGGRLLVDACIFQDYAGGIARVWTEILLEWASRGAVSRIFIVDRARTAPRFAGYTYIDVPRYEYANDAAEQLRLGAICGQVGANAFASTYFSIAAGIPNLLLVHDMIPERAVFDLSLPMWQQKRRAIEAAVGFAVVSLNSARDFAAYYPDAARRPTILAPNGVARRFSPPTEEEASAFRRGFCAKALGGRPHVMFINRGIGIKNGALLKEALTIWPNRIHHSLLVTTQPNQADEWYPLLPDMPFNASYFFDEGLRLAYGTAHCLVYPSIYEGFGLPILEAMACGCPVICSNSSSLPEVAGDAALFIDPRDAQALVRALDEVGRPDTRALLIGRGLTHTRAFGWARSVLALETLLQRIAPV